MNLKTTLVLLVLTVAGAVWFYTAPPLPSWLGGSSRPVDPVPAVTLDILEKELTAAKLQRIEIRQDGKTIILDKGGAGWTIDGKWLTRERPVQELVGLLTGLRSRFTPILVGDDRDKLRSCGLDRPELTVVVVAGPKSYRLTLGEDPADSNRFTRATFLRLGELKGTEWTDRPEVVRLAPGLVAALSRPLDYYLQRRLFPSERVAKDSDSPEKVDRLVARSITVTGLAETFDWPERNAMLVAGGLPVAAAYAATFKLVRKGNDWELEKPYRDAPDPARVQTLLTAIPDLWAEQFVRVDKNPRTLQLDDPAPAITVERSDGSMVTLRIGKKSRTEERRAARPVTPFAPPPPPEEPRPFYYAQLQGNDQLFEIKGDRLKDVFVALDSVRDSKLARFTSDSVQQVEVKLKDAQIVLARKDGKWGLEKPVAAAAEASKVTELLGKLAGLEARGSDVLHPVDLKDFSLDPPAGTVVLTIEEEVKDGKDDSKKEKKTRQLRFHLGKHDAEKKKLYLRVDDWPRINAVDEELFKLVDRPALAYRSRTIFDLADIEGIDIQRADEKYSLKKTADKWRLSAPVDAEADSARMASLVGDLAGLTVVEYVAEDAKEEDLDKLYGLAKPDLTVSLHGKGVAKPITLRIGKQREGKDEYYARRDDAPQVFTVPKSIREQIDRPSLSLRPLELWQIAAGEVAGFRIVRQKEPEYRLEREKENWKIAGPFAATVPADSVTPLLNSLAALKCDRYETHASKELDKYGLDSPEFRVAVRDAGQEKVLLIGKATAADAKTRFARLENSDAVFVVGNAVVDVVNRDPLDLLDRTLLRLDDGRIVRIRSIRGADVLTIERKDDRWQAETAQVKFAADAPVVSGVLQLWANLRAHRFAAHGSAIDFSRYGLAKPELTVTVQLEPSKGEKTVEHILKLGSLVEGSKDQRYARLDEQPAVVVLGSAAVAELTRSTLDFVDRSLLDFDAKAVTGISRKLGAEELELKKAGDGWQITRPDPHKADDQTLDKLVTELARLRATRIAAYPAGNLKKFGLDDPAAVLTIRLGDKEGKPNDRLLKIGEAADPPGQTTGDRYALVEGTDKVAVLPGTLVRPLVAKPLYFRDRALARFITADKVVLDRGPRKAVFENVNGIWKMTAPVLADADQTDLDEFINAVARLRADELVSDRPDDLKSFGLDPPELRWQFFNGDKEVLNLAIGDREKSKELPRVHGRLAGSDLVFLLDGKLTARVLGEYRSRKLWEPIDAFQVDRLESKAGGGDPRRKSFALDKLGENWIVPGKPAAKVNSAKVSETLATLATLRAERYVVDKDADFKLVGLDPPHLTVEVRSKTGTRRSIQIGSREGESRRHYARLTENNRSDVFVISEADAGKIVRDLEGFLEVPDKP